MIAPLAGTALPHHQLDLHEVADRAGHRGRTDLQDLREFAGRAPSLVGDQQAREHPRRHPREARPGQVQGKPFDEP